MQRIDLLCKWTGCIQEVHHQLITAGYTITRVFGKGSGGKRTENTIQKENGKNQESEGIVGENAIHTVSLRMRNFGELSRRAYNAECAAKGL